MTAPIVGAPDAVALEAGVTELEPAEAELVPTELVAVTVNVKLVPLVSPVTVIGLLGPVPVKPPGLEVTV